MLEDADSALRALLAAGLPKDTRLGFAPPDRDWRTEIGDRPSVNAFLVQLRENVDARSAHWTDVYDEQSRIVGRQEPIRHFRVHYVLTAWAEHTETEHALLGAALRVLTAGVTVPARFLSGSLAGRGELVTVDVAHPDLPTLALDAWSAWGVPPRACLDVVLGVPLVPDVRTDLARRPEAIDLVMADTPPARPMPSDAPAPRGRITENR